MLSIIIPTYNEEKYLPRLLESIKKQNLQNIEIIVADNNSKDETREIAKKYGAIVVKGGLPGKARNNGAKVAKGEILLFLDSDVVLTNGFLKKALNEFKRRRLSIAIASVKADSDKDMDKLVYVTMDIVQKTAQYFKAVGAGCCGIMIKKGIHNRIEGFSEWMRIGEDTDYILRASEYGKFRVLKPNLYVSARRFEIEGRFSPMFKYVKSSYYQLIGKNPAQKIDYNYYDYANKLEQDRRI